MSDKPTILRIVMPSAGDMELVSNKDGIIELMPIYFGNESMGPHILIMEGDKVIERTKLRIKDNKIEIKRSTVVEN